MTGVAFGVLPARLLAAGGNAADLQRACGPPGSRSWLCETVFRISGSNGAADVADAVSKPVGVVLVIVLAYVATLFARRVIARLADRLKVGAAPGTTAVRDYQRHWTPVHLDCVVDDLDAAVERAVKAGAKLDRDLKTQKWGRLANLSDPFGNGFCLLEFRGRGYDELLAAP